MVALHENQQLELFSFITWKSLQYTALTNILFSHKADKLNL